MGAGIRSGSVRFILLLVAVSVLAAGCYVMGPSSGGGEHERKGARQVNPKDVLTPPGYRVEVVATGLTFPTGVTFDREGRVYVVESGYSYGEIWTTPRLLRIEPGGATTTIYAGAKNGPWTGVTFADGAFYMAEGGELEGGRILRVTMDGKASVLISDLPSMGDHHTDGPVMGPDGWIYFGQGTASNSGIVGEDNARFGWLKRRPEFHDVPGRDIKLAGVNFVSDEVGGNKPDAKAITGAYMPFGASTTPGQVIHGTVPCSGSVMRIRPDGSQLELVAWGLRNPFGLGFNPDGKLYVTDNGYDDRGSRPVWGAPDLLCRIEPGTWYGWPDFSAGMPLTDPRFKPPGKAQPQFLLAEHPGVPPKPVAQLAVHSSADGLDFSRNPAFGFEGQAFIALFGDQAPDVGKVLEPVGFRVVRVDTETGVTQTFAANRGKIVGPASRYGGGGLERPLAVRFNPAGDTLYVVDFGVLAEDEHGAHPQSQTGVLWRIRRER